MSAQIYNPNGIIHYTNVDFVERNISVPIHVVKGDDSLPLIDIELLSNGQPYIVPDGADVNFRMRKNDGTYIYNPALGLDSSRTHAYISITAQTASSAGDYEPDLEVVLNSKVAGSSKFKLLVDKSNIEGIESANELQTLYAVIADAKTVAENIDAVKTVDANISVIKASPDNALKSEGYSSGTQNGTEVKDGPYYKNNAAYYLSMVKAIAESITGLIPLNTSTFEALPPIAEVVIGGMYNISDDFTTTAEFEEGTGIKKDAGTNIYKTKGGKWDCLSGNTITKNEFNALASRTAALESMCIGGNNLLTGSKDFSGTWVNASAWTTEVDKYRGFTVKKTTTVNYGLSQAIIVPNNTTIVYSFFAKTDTPSSPFAVYAPNTGATSDFDRAYESVSLTTNWKRYQVSFTSKVDNAHANLNLRILSTAPAGSNAYICAPCLQYGDKATEWLPNELDYIGDLSSTGVAGDTASDQIKQINTDFTDKQEKINTIIASIGRIYKPSSLSIVRANQAWKTLSSMFLPQGVYVVTASAKHSSTSVCDISISKSIDSEGWCKQCIYGNRAYDVNAGSISTIVEMESNGTLYFTTWAESDFEITSMSFIATRI